MFIFLPYRSFRPFLPIFSRYVNISIHGAFFVLLATQILVKLNPVLEIKNIDVQCVN